VKQIVENVMKYDRFVIVTGAGLSAASGIPTFRGTGGYWTNIIEGDNQEVYEAK
jgi:NAD-dependent SIR2 family protein deacetylase